VLYHPITKNIEIFLCLHLKNYLKEKLYVDDIPLLDIPLQIIDKCKSTKNTLLLVKNYLLLLKNNNQWKQKKLKR